MSPAAFCSAMSALAGFQSKHERGICETYLVFHRALNALPVLPWVTHHQHLWLWRGRPVGLPPGVGR